MSRADRAASLANAWRMGFDGVYSNYDLVDPDTNIIARNRIAHGDARSRLPWLSGLQSRHFIYGATSAYSKEIINSLIEPQKKIQSEDMPLNTIIHLRGGKIHLIQEPLVLYRAHENTLSNSSAIPKNINSIVKHEIKEQEKASSHLALLLYIREILMGPIGANSPQSQIQVTSINYLIEFVTLKAGWQNLSFAKKLKSILLTRSTASLKWAILRIAGLRTYALLKWVQLSISSPMTSGDK